MISILVLAVNLPSSFADNERVDPFHHVWPMCPAICQRMTWVEMILCSYSGPYIILARFLDRERPKLLWVSSKMVLVSDTVGSVSGHFWTICKQSGLHVLRGLQRTSVCLKTSGWSILYVHQGIRKTLLRVLRLLRSTIMEKNYAFSKEVFCD